MKSASGPRGFDAEPGSEAVEAAAPSGVRHRQRLSLTLGLLLLVMLATMPALRARADDSHTAPPARGSESTPPPPTQQESAALDARVRSFLEQHRGQWHDLNVPFEDGQQLYDWIVQRRFTRALEIGTSTGHSGIWIAWALSKTGGKLITLEIDPERHRTAMANFEAAGVSRYVDARLGNAHDLVKKLPGPFDFVFSDADKGWYTQYFKDLEGKLTVGGCFTAHNVLDDFAGIREFLAYVRSRAGFTTTIAHTSSSGISLSCRTR
jgi:caffeoyl-CoA O-methyltransferase